MMKPDPFIIVRKKFGIFSEDFNELLLKWINYK